MLAKAITGHKSQGLGLSALLLHCDEKHVVEPGWLFTAITRMKVSAEDRALKLRIITPPFAATCPALLKRNSKYRREGVKR